MRSIICFVVLAACGGGSSPTIDAAPTPGIDAAPSTRVQQVCTDTCTKIGQCFMEPAPPECVADCGADLADCTEQQLDAVEACAMGECGPNGETIGMCIQMVACVMG